MLAKRLTALAVFLVPTVFAVAFAACIGGPDAIDAGLDATTDVQKAEVSTGAETSTDAVSDVNPYPLPCMIATPELIDAGDASTTIYLDGGASAALQSFNSHMYGCSGTVTYANRAALCNAAKGCATCTAAEWVVKYGNVAPTHEYWVDDSLGYAGNGPPANDCFAGPLTDGGIIYSCGPNPMRVCIDGPLYDGGFVDAGYAYRSVDTEGNVCNWTACDLITNPTALDASPDAQTANLHFGGCAGDTTSGALCCCP